MSENVNVSFIPKKSLARNEFVRGEKIFGATFIVSLSIALLSVGLATYSFFTLRTLKQERTVNMKELEAYRNSLVQDKLIENINKEKDFAQKTKVAKILLTGHVAPSYIFEYLEKTTPTTVSYESFSYTKKDDSIVVGMQGRIGSYELLAALSQWYKKQSVITDFTFNNFSPSPEGDISFSFKGTLNPTLISYSNQYTQKNESSSSVLTDAAVTSSKDIPVQSGTTSESVSTKVQPTR